MLIWSIKQRFQTGAGSIWTAVQEIVFRKYRMHQSKRLPIPMTFRNGRGMAQMPTCILHLARSQANGS